MAVLPRKVVYLVVAYVIGCLLVVLHPRGSSSQQQPPAAPAAPAAASRRAKTEQPAVRVALLPRPAAPAARSPPHRQAAGERHTCDDSVAAYEHPGGLRWDAAGLSEPLAHNVTRTGFVAQSAYDYYQLCIAAHGHEHQVLLLLQAVEGEQGSSLPAGDPDLYVSTQRAQPTLRDSDWISAGIGSDSLKLSTHLREFSQHSGAHTLFIAVYGRRPGAYKLTAIITPVKRSLRGR